METRRTANVARTAYDLKHFNRLRAPDFWLVKLWLQVGGNSSKSYLSPDAPNASAASSGSDDFHFAPEKEKPDINYEIDDPFAMIRRAKLELFRRYDEKVLWAIDLTKLGEDTYLHGKHALKWDGRVTKDPTAVQAGTKSDAGMGQDLTQVAVDKTVCQDFPDGYITLQQTPYKLRLTVSDKKEGEANAKVVIAWTYFHILLEKIELELGPKKSLPKAQAGKPDLDAQVYDDDDGEALNGSLPAAGGLKKIFLSSNIFKNSNGQMHNNTDFTSYQKLWGDGPNIPVFAKLWIRDSGDQPVEAPKALGKVKFMWDAEDVKEKDGSVYGGHHAKAKAFLDDSVNYDADKTKPKGDNCHKDRGGKRGDDSKYLFPEQKGYGYGFGGDFDSDAKQDDLKDRQFPFKAQKCETRKWSAYSYAWTQGKLENKTGVLFQPSRLAGDAYKITVYLANEKRDNDNKKILLDTDKDLPKVVDKIKKSTGTIEIWRRLNFVQYKKKTTTVSPDFAVATFQGYYQQAYVQVKYTAGAATAMVKADYDSKFATAKTGQPWYVTHMLSTASQYDAGKHGADFRSWGDFKTAAKAAKGWSDAELNAFLGTVLNTEEKYNKYCDGIASDILTKLCESYMDVNDGINLFQFVEHYNLATAPGGLALNGFAPGAAVGPKKADPTNTQCFFVLCAGPTNYDGSDNTPAQTVTHEIGHCLFMAHAPVQTATDEANKHDVTVHDKNFNNCTMSYNYDAERKWCGFCILRLRGWDRNHLQNDGAFNKKT
jgi:hypothetical protein